MKHLSDNCETQYSCCNIIGVYCIAICTIDVLHQQVTVGLSWLSRFAYLMTQRLSAVVLWQTRRALGGAHLPPTKLFPRLAVNKTILKPRVAATTGAQHLYVGFPDVIKFCVAAHTISEKAIRFRHSDYNPDRAQKLISSSMSQHPLRSTFVIMYRQSLICVFVCLFLFWFMT